MPSSVSFRRCPEFNLISSYQWDFFLLCAFFFLSFMIDYSPFAFSPKLWHKLLIQWNSSAIFNLPHNWDRLNQHRLGSTPRIPLHYRLDHLHRMLPNRRQLMIFQLFSFARVLPKWGKCDALARLILFRVTEKLFPFNSIYFHTISHSSGSATIPFNW